MLSRKYPSGSSERRKRKNRADDFIETQKGALDKFFKNNSSASTNPNNELAMVVVMEEEVPNIEISEEENVNLNVENNVSDPKNLANSSGVN
jgi:hypothetical protein